LGSVSHFACPFRSGTARLGPVVRGGQISRDDGKGVGEAAKPNECYNREGIRRL
jgi:hypothetical protein